MILADDAGLQFVHNSTFGSIPASEVEPFGKREEQEYGVQDGSDLILTPTCMLSLLLGQDEGKRCSHNTERAGDIRQ